MSDYHVLEQDGYHLRVIHHFAMPAGNNAVGVSWKAAGLAAGVLGTTRLVEGTGPGQITTAEKAQITAGDVVEIEVIVAIARTLTPAQTLAAITAQATLAATQFSTEMQARLRLYGGTS